MFGKRPDATLVTNLNTLRRFMPYISPRRNDSLFYMMQDIEVEAALEFLEKRNLERPEARPMTLFHLFLRSCAQALYLRPGVNRFVKGGRLWQRDGEWITFSAKKEIKDGSPMITVKRRFHPTTETLDALFESSPQAKELHGSAFGYAVFSNIKISLVITGGGGHGVAVNRQSGQRTYMHMGTAGLNLGLGGQKYQVVFLFETEKAFRDFVDVGWQAEASANAAAGTKGANAAAGFRNGVAIYQITDKGLMAQADISGTKYWKSKKLN